MTFEVLVTKRRDKQYTARVLLFPDIVVTGRDEQEVLAQVQSAIADLRASSHIVRLDVPPIPGGGDDPWLRFAGQWADDPDWDQFQDEIERFRQEMQTNESSSMD
jgi:Asp-tRNA(Asn)/Glu-tRNA(Gln) amidotransferase A subunit family amidase